MGRRLFPAHPGRGPIELQCPIRVVSVHLLGTAGQFMRVLFLDREGAHQRPAPPHGPKRGLDPGRQSAAGACASGPGAGALRSGPGGVIIPSLGGSLRRAAGFMQGSCVYGFEAVAANCCPPLAVLRALSIVKVSNPRRPSCPATARIDVTPKVCFNLKKHAQARPSQLAYPSKHPPHPPPPMATATKPAQAPGDWKPQAQTEEQVAEGLREAFRQAVREGVVTPQSDQRRSS
jgi:hypothetical protein